MSDTPKDISGKRSSSPYYRKRKPSASSRTASARTRTSSSRNASAPTRTASSRTASARTRAASAERSAIKRRAYEAEKHERPASSASVRTTARPASPASSRTYTRTVTSSPSRKSARPVTSSSRKSARPVTYSSSRRSARPAMSASLHNSARPDRNTYASGRAVPAQKRKTRKRKKSFSFKRILLTVLSAAFFLFSIFVFSISVRFLVNSILLTTNAENTSSENPDAGAAVQKPEAQTVSLDVIDDDDQKNAEPEEVLEPEAAAKEPVSITITLVGDCTLGTEDSFAYSTSLNQYYDDYGPEYFFDNVRDIFEADDLTIANLECSFTDATIRGEHTYCFKAPASYTEILTSSSIDAVNLANNHTYDWLEKGYTDTCAALDAASLPHFGYEETAVVEVKGIKIGLVGTYEIIEGIGIETQLKANIEKVKAEGAQIVVVVFHWGDELDLAPNSNQFYLARKAVDFGADLVCGGHAHVIQGMETYKGKNILYGMANFCFGGNVYPHDLDTIIYQQTFTIDENGLKDDLVTNIIPCSCSSASGYNNYQPTPATGADAERILNKLKERSDALPTI